MAAPMPVPPPVISACLPSRAPITPSPVTGLGARGEAIELVAAGEIRLGPGRARVAGPRGGVQRPVGIGQVRPGEADEVGAAGHQDRVDVVGLVDVADRHGGDADLVADAVGERRLEHAAVDRARLDGGLAGRHVDDVDALGLQDAGDGDRLHRRDAAIRPPSRWPRCAPRWASPPATPCGQLERPRAGSAGGSPASRRRRRCGGW